MPALTGNFSKIGLSFTYDGLTVYYNFPVTKQDVQVIVEECKKREILVEAPSNEMEAKNKSFFTIKTQMQFDKIVQGKNPDHSLYHQDSFHREQTHAHLKFKQAIQEKELEQMLDIFVTNSLLTKEEKQEFLNNYHARYQRVRGALEKSLSNQCDPEKDARVILNFIKSYKDNDILSYLHTYLASSQFNYLRQFTLTTVASSLSNPKQEMDSGDIINTIQWQGTDANGKIVETSKQWATIEKAITLQLMQNIKEQTTFGKYISVPRAYQLSRDLCFFKIKRKLKHGTDKTNNAYQAFLSANEVEFARKYKKSFS